MRHATDVTYNFQQIAMLQILHQQVYVSTVLLQPHHIDNEGVLHLTEKAKFIPQMLLLLRIKNFLFGNNFYGANFVGWKLVDFPVSTILTT